jgi:hypothetical protein
MIMYHISWHLVLSLKYSDDAFTINTRMFEEIAIGAMNITASAKLCTTFQSLA